MIGTFGEIPFEVSANRLRTFDEFVRRAQGRWENHDIEGAKPRSEFLGPGLDTITFTMRFDASHGVNPKTEMDRFLALAQNGKPQRLLIGGRALGVNKWKVTTVGQTWQNVDNKGNVIVGTVDVTLEEYV